MKTLALALIFAGAAAAATEAVLYKFQGNQGVLPAGRLIADASGRIYGVTELGGTPGCGTVFQLTPPTAGAGWTAATLYEFQGGADGCSPGTDILLATDASGNFYGTTRGGGTGTCVGNYTGCGTVFQLAPPALAGGAWTETVLYKFASGGDGAFPNGGVVLGPNGVFYGTTSDTGDSGHYGSAFVLHPPVIPGGAWTKTTLYTFTGGADGNSPFGNLSRDRNGNLYGITLAGGAKGWGAVFEISQAKPGLWTETVLYSFLGLPDGYNPPSGVVRDKAGNLYGVTSSGGATNHGTIYELSPPVQAGGAWTYAVLYSFLGAPDGYYPIGSPSSIRRAISLARRRPGGQTRTSAVSTAAGPFTNWLRQHRRAARGRKPCCTGFWATPTPATRRAACCARTPARFTVRPWGAVVPTAEAFFRSIHSIE